MTNEQFAKIRKKMHASLQALGGHKEEKIEEVDIQAVQAKVHASLRLIFRQVAEIKEVVEADQATAIAAAQSAAEELTAHEEERLAELKGEYAEIDKAVTTVYNNLFDRFADNFEENVDDITPEQLEKLIAPDNYEFDDRSFRIALNESIDELKNLVPAWCGQRGLVFAKLYDQISDSLSDLLKHDKKNAPIDFCKDYFNAQFKPYVDEHNMMPPNDIWRRIHLCAVSQVWKDITIAAFRKLSETAILDEAERRNLDVNKASKLILGKELD